VLLQHLPQVALLLQDLLRLLLVSPERGRRGLLFQGR